jgi:hypothetical protein
MEGKNPPNLEKNFSCFRNTRSDLHCNEDPIYVFPEKELRGLSPNFHIQFMGVVSDLYIPRISPHIFLQQNGQVDRSWEYINRSQTHECGNFDWGRAIPFLWILVWILDIASLHCVCKNQRNIIYILVSAGINWREETDLLQGGVAKWQGSVLTLQFQTTFARKRGRGIH